MIRQIKETALKMYAKRFCNTVKREQPKFINTSKEPTIKFYTQKCFADINDFKDYNANIFEVENEGILIDGFFSKKDTTIEIYNVLNEDLTELKRTIRHECLHFLLYESGQPWSDTDKLFIALSIAYDARPYGLFNMTKGE